MKENKRSRSIKDLKSIDRRITDYNVIEESLLIVKVQNSGRKVIENLVKQKPLENLKIIAAVSEDVDIRNKESTIWGIFTRFDCERDVIFSEQSLIGISPVYKGVMGIDATWKKGYPAPLTMDPKIVKRVDERWDSYWK